MLILFQIVKTDCYLSLFEFGNALRSKFPNEKEPAKTPAVTPFFIK